MKRITCIVLTALSALGVVFLMPAAGADSFTDAERCFGSDARTNELIIAGCTALIQSNRMDNGRLTGAFLRRGSAYFNLHQYDKAIEDNYEVIKRYPNNADAFLILGAARFRLRRYNAAIEDYSEAIKLKTDNIKAIVSRGAAYVALKQYDLAMADYDHVIASKPNIPAFRYRASLYHRLGQYDRELADLRRATELKPVNFQDFDVQGAAFDILDQPLRAVQDYNQAIALKPDDGDAFNGRCYAQALRGKNLDDALMDCNRALELLGDSPGALNSRALVYFRKGDYAKSLADYDAALVLNSKSANSLYVRGIVKRKGGDKSGGDADIAAANAIDPKTSQYFSSYNIKP